MQRQQNEHMQGAAAQKSMVFPLKVFTLTFLFLWTWMRLVLWIFPSNLSPHSAIRPYYMGVVPESNQWLAGWQRWDVLHYQAIAEHGYDAFETALFTPPLYPLLMRFASMFTGGNTLLGGLTISLLACIFGLLAFQRLALFELGKESLANKAVLYLALFPTAFFLFAPYTESLFMLCSILCLLHVRQKNWLASGIWGMLAASARLTGAVILLPVAWAAWEDWKLNKNWKVWLSPMMVFGAAIIFPLYAWVGLGKSPLAPFEAQSQRFHGGFSFPGLNIIEAIQQAFLGNYVMTNLLDVFFLLLFLGLGFLVWKKLPLLYTVYYTGFILLYITRTADVYPLLGMTRYVLALFPAFLVLPEFGENPIIHRIILYTSILGLLFLSAQYVIWGWVG